MQYKLVASTMVALSIAVAAESRQDAHEHGVAHLKVALDDRTLLIEFESPLDNLVGFEHAPRTAQQYEALAVAQARLKDAEALFGLAAQAQCVLQDVQVESPWALAGERADEMHDAHARHQHDPRHHGEPVHDAQHRHEKHDRHSHTQHQHAKDDHAHHGESSVDRARHAHHAAAQGDGHAELYAVYEFDCAQPQALRAIDFGLFDAFPRIRSLRAETATPAGQGAMTLDKAARRLSL